MTINQAELDRRFDHHPPDGDAVARHVDWRATVKAVAREAMNLLPDGREQALVLTALEEALMWGNAAIARKGQ